ncbi:hypothetical protein Hanom_Chr12g01176371 [Helianthus anomalus]
MAKLNCFDVFKETRIIFQNTLINLCRCMHTSLPQNQSKNSILFGHYGAIQRS